MTTRDTTLALFAAKPYSHDRLLRFGVEAANDPESLIIAACLHDVRPASLVGRELTYEHDALIARARAHRRAHWRRVALRARLRRAALVQAAALPEPPVATPCGQLVQRRTPVTSRGIDIENARDRMAAGETAAAIATDLGITEHGLRRALANRLDRDAAQRMLDAGSSPRDVAMAQGVSAQAIHAAVKDGRLVRRPRQQGNAAA